MPEASAPTPLDLAEHLERLGPLYGPLADFLRLREQGLRDQALARIQHLIAAAGAWDEADRRGLVEGLGRVAHRWPQSRGWLLSHPLRHGLIRPVLEHWEQGAPTDPAPHRWRGILFGDGQALERALALGPDDGVTRQALVDWILADLYTATERVPEHMRAPGGPLQAAIERGLGLVAPPGTDARSDAQREALRALRRDLVR